MRNKAILVHLNAFVSVTPLVGGYLKAFAQTEPELRNGWDIELYNTYVRTPASEIIQYLMEEKPEVIGFSVYTWNVGLVSRLLPALRGVLPPVTRFLLGGVEVMHCGQNYINVSWENVAVCNGEGEQTFRDFLLQMGCERPDFDKVRGISFYRDGAWITTEGYPRIRDLSQIPSPWLNDLFDPRDMTEIGLFETNRGCPFACEFCYWGGAVGQKVNKLALDRIKEEISYISRHRIKQLNICDANFGILEHDIEIAEHISAMKRNNRFPLRVIYSAAKNNYRRVEEVARMFIEAGLLSNQVIPMQSLNQRALDIAKRSNIKLETYTRLQKRLNEWGVPSLVELIWPMPGETLDSFKDGVDKLIGMGAQAFAIHPLLWLNNVGYQKREEELGVAVLQEDDPDGGGRMVIKTREVSYHDCIEGLLFAMAVLLLYSCRGLYLTMHLLNSLKLVRFREVLDEFVTWIDNVSDDAISILWRDGKTRFEKMGKTTWRGAAIHAALHEHRRDLDRLLKSFIAAHDSWFEDDTGDYARIVTAATEFDLLNRPYLYVQTPLEVGVQLEHFQIKQRHRGRWLVDSAYDFPRIIRKLRSGETLTHEDLVTRKIEIDIDHRAGQIYRLPTKTDEEHYLNCYQIVREIGKIEARHKVLVPRVVASC
jgi:putative methyltransferase